MVKKGKKAARPLEDCKIALSGSFGSTHATIGDRIKSAGGTVARTVDKDCTHLIVTPASVNNGSAAVQKAESLPGVSVVSLAWLSDSCDQGKRLPEANYSLVAGAVAPPTDSADAKDTTSTSKTKKRRRADTPELDEDAGVPAADDTEQSTKKLKSEPKSSSTGLNVPIDENCTMNDVFHVLIASDGTIYDATLNQTAVQANANKFYRLQVLVGKGGKHAAWFRWGRVGERGQNSLQWADSEATAISIFEKKFREKSGLPWAKRDDPPKPGKYAYIERDYAADASDDDDKEHGGAEDDADKGKPADDVPLPDSKLPERVQRLIELLFNMEYFTNALASMKYDANKLPLGKLSQKTLRAGYQKLKQLAEILVDPAKAPELYQRSHAQMVTTLTNEYYTLIPHCFGRERPPMIGTDRALKAEVEKLDNLSNMGMADEIMQVKRPTDADGKPIHVVDNQYRQLGIREMTPLEASSDEYRELKTYLLESNRTGHGLNFKVEDIFRVERAGEHDRFSSRSTLVPPEKSDRRLLWHGSVTTNFAGILTQGLRIAPPEAPVNGYMFGKGIYLADASSKSANYCRAYQSGNIALLLLCEAEIGKPTQVFTQGASYEAAETAAKQGMVATEGRGRVAPSKWKDASAVHPDLSGVQMPDMSAPEVTVADAYLQYNEYVIYHEGHVRLRYLFRVTVC